MQYILTAHRHMRDLLRLIIFTIAIGFLVRAALRVSTLPHVFANLFLYVGSGLGVYFFKLRLYEEFPG